MLPFSITFCCYISKLISNLNINSVYINYSIGLFLYIQAYIINKYLINDRKCHHK